MKKLFLMFVLMAYLPYALAKTMLIVAKQKKRRAEARAQSSEEEIEEGLKRYNHRFELN